MPDIRGTDFNFFVVRDGIVTLLCRSRDFTLNTTTDELETTGPTNGSWRSFLPGLNSYTLSAQGLVNYTDNFNIVQLQEVENSREVVEWFAGLSPSGGLQYHGYMFITSIQMTSQFRDTVQFDMTARGTGPQDILKNPITKSVYLANKRGVRLAGCPNPYPVGVLWYDDTFIGVAETADEVMTVFNEYSATQGNFLQLTGFTTGCDFTMEVAWNSPLDPNIVVAIPGGAFVLAGGGPNDVIGESEENVNVISG